jgi:hypothetical protein
MGGLWFAPHVPSSHEPYVPYYTHWLYDLVLHNIGRDLAQSVGPALFELAHPVC